MKQIRPGFFLALLLLIAFLFTTAGNARAASGVSISPASDAKSGLPGSVVTYTISLTNNDAASVTIDASASTVGSWTTSVNPTSLTLAAAGSDGSTKTVTVYVHVDEAATSGQNVVTLVKFSDHSSSTEIGSVQLTTTAQPPAPTSAPTAIPEEPTSVSTGRALLVVTGYDTGGAAVQAGKEFALAIEFKNNGALSATNILVTFDSPDFLPLSTGGVRAINVIDSGKKVTITQHFLVSDALAWQSVASLKVNVTYDDRNGVSYSGAFNLTINIAAPTSSGSYATATPNVPLRPQLVVTNYKADIDPLQPGSVFTLNLDVRNLGNADASTISMVLGGGGTSGGNDSGTPSAGGVAGAGGDLSNFAPLGSSNIVYLGNLARDVTLSIPVKLIVNVSTQPGAYPLKLSFVYADPKGNRLVDDQVITLLVYSLPQVEINFYRDPGVIYAGMPTVLPLQVTNLGKKNFVLGNMKVTAENAEVTNNVSLVGSLDPGGYYTLDANLMPYQEGTLEIQVMISYTDDFNQPRFLTQTIQVEVQPAMDMGPTDGEGTLTPDGEGGKPIDGVVPAPETFLQKVWRFLKGLLGLDSGAGGTSAPTTEAPTESAPIKVPGPKG